MIIWILTVIGRYCGKQHPSINYMVFFQIGKYFSNAKQVLAVNVQNTVSNLYQKFVHTNMWFLCILHIKLGILDILRTSRQLCSEAIMICNTYYIAMFIHIHLQIRNNQSVHHHFHEIIVFTP